MVYILLKGYTLHMETDKNLLKVISNETINSVHNINIVTPSIYKSFFEKHAVAHGTKIDNEEEFTDTLLNEKILMCDIVQDKNAKNTLQLSDNTNKAIKAIKEKDEAVLVQVLQETILLRKEIEELKEAVYKDELTNVYNRKWMHDKFLNIDSDNFKKSGTLAMIDLNFFKLVNDTYGHIIGDKVLIFIANQLKITKEKVVRYGGDEFIILFGKTIDQDTAFSKLNHIREKIISKKLKAGDISFRVSFSIGAYEFEEGDSLASIIELADKNMYADKIKIKERITGID